MLDGYGCIRHLPEPGSIREQPAIDMHIYEIARGRWIELMKENAERGAT